MENLVTEKYNKLVEGAVAVYIMITAVLFHFTDSLSHSVYEPMIDIMSSTSWSYFLALVALGHISALYLNGTTNFVSSPVRMVTCFLHMLGLGTIAYCFVKSGVYWPVSTMGFLSFLLVTPLVESVKNTFCRNRWEMRWREN